MTLQERRAIARAAGKCGSCRLRMAAPGKKSCERCLTAHSRTGANSTKRREVLQVNICCQSHGEHRFDCGEVEKRGAGPFLVRRVA